MHILLVQARAGLESCWHVINKNTNYQEDFLLFWVFRFLIAGSVIRAEGCTTNSDQWLSKVQRISLFTWINHHCKLRWTLNITCSWPGLEFWFKTAWMGQIFIESFIGSMLKYSLTVFTVSENVMQFSKITSKYLYVKILCSLKNRHMYMENITLENNQQFIKKKKKEIISHQWASHSLINRNCYKFFVREFCF